MKNWVHMGGVSGPEGSYSVSHYKGINSLNEQCFMFQFYRNGKKTHETFCTDLDKLYQSEEKFLDYCRKYKPVFQVTTHKENYGACMVMGWAK